jgi:hypothetical protein
VIFVSVAVVDSDVFKGASEVPALEARTRQALAAYETFARALGLATASEYAVGTEVVAEAEQLALGLAWRYPKALVVGGQIVFEQDSTWNRLLHNETAFLIQRRLQHRGVPMIVLPIQLELRLSRLARRSERVVLGRLSCEQVADWVEQVTGNRDLGVARRVHDASDGNPLFVSELVRPGISTKEIDEAAADLM